MKTLKLTKNDFKETKNYWREYIGKEDISNFDGHLEVEGNLGYVKFTSVKVSGGILVKAGSGIKVDLGIKVGEGIKVGWGIKVGEGIKVGSGIEVGEGIEVGSGIVSW